MSFFLPSLSLSFSPSHSLSLTHTNNQLTEHDDGGRPLPPRRPHARRRRDEREQRAAGEAEEHRDGPVGELKRQRGRGGTLSGGRSSSLPGDGRRPLHGKVDEEGIKKDGDQVVERRRGDDERRDALGRSEAALLQVKHQLDHNRRPDGLEDEAQGISQKPRHAEDSVGDGPGDESLDDPGHEQQAQRCGPGAAEDCPVELEARPQENDRQSSLPDL